MPSASRRRLGRRLLAAALASGVLAAPLAASTAHAHSYTLKTIAVGHVYSPGMTDGGLPIYGALFNRGSEPAHLVAVTAGDGTTVRFRRVSKDGEVSFLDDITLPPGKPVSLAPWGPHLWITGMTPAPELGTTFPVELDFGEAGEIEVDIVVESTPSH
ncbi:copper chaperone PCu(A)C [Acuticoccus mangrovi]|uniref:Copper chaperone PCu(A)C n=1 Tax=Acuticoccus mangrovi TaxID=2796142 RepID=A0A934IPB7_9HYPH|nr:copper chaperone PCu(A)C [Acuticoccus mangrovi]MBJ3776093.1 copper chaperone PCu(A)C [Acuticoccus mangrovi]